MLVCWDAQIRRRAGHERYALPSDLKSLVRTVHCLSRQRLPIVEDTFDAAQRYWDNVAYEYSAFRLAMLAANTAKYDELEQVLRRCLW